MSLSESTKVKLQEDLSFNQDNNQQVKDLEDNVMTLTSQLDVAREKWMSTEQELAKEKARVKSLDKQNEVNVIASDSMLNINPKNMRHMMSHIYNRIQ